MSQGTKWHLKEKSFVLGYRAEKKNPGRVCDLKNLFKVDFYFHLTVRFTIVNTNLTSNTFHFKHCHPRQKGLLNCDLIPCGALASHPVGVKILFCRFMQQKPG